VVADWKKTNASNQIWSNEWEGQKSMKIKT
jgi:hypothetical protein